MDANQAPAHVIVQTIADGATRHVPAAIVTVIVADVQAGRLTLQAACRVLRQLDAAYADA